ncbi:stealth protein CR2 [Ilumatobacter fluminis]|uniref:Stealth protein CR2 n=1 Tax=Ilumatobacter fluminis TaxID=467091 RepID=A0A4R7I1F3_9ACTN|nr:hypothetical protein [Ilumatobacter fluminis]TDT17311.1 stealth protein CR2 [Ilumatobacter fluminis]
MNDIAFLLSNQYQAHHYAPIARHLGDVTVIVDRREQDFGVDDQFLAGHFPGAAVTWVDHRDLALLDGRFRLIVCQTPVLPQRLLRRTLVVAQQYSVAKEAYQFGAWRSLPDLNLLYGPASESLVSGFAVTRTCGNPALDAVFGKDGDRPRRPASKPIRALYMPTYGDLSSIDSVLPGFREFEGSVTIKLHHADRGRLGRGDVPDGCEIVGAEASVADLFESHDFVLSDVSGAAFDAACAGLPLVVVDRPSVARDRHRQLSPAEWSQSSVSTRSVGWQPGGDLERAAIDAAAIAADRSAYETWVGTQLVERGTAGEACARAIIELLERGPDRHFGRERVAESQRALLRQTTELSGDLRRTRRRLATARASRFGAMVQLRDGATDAVRRAAARSPRIERALVETSHRLGKAAQVGVAARSSVVSVREPPSTWRGTLVDELSRSVPGLLVAPARGKLSVGVEQSRRLELLEGLRSTGPRLGGFMICCRLDDTLVVIGDVGALDADVLRRATAIRVGPAGSEAPESSLEIELLAPSASGLVAIDPRASRADWGALGDVGAGSDVRGGTLWPGHRASVVDVAYLLPGSVDRSPSSRLHADCRLRYSMRSLALLAPFVRNVYLVTAEPRPSWASDESALIVVGPRELVPEGALASPDPRLIGSAVRRIPGLSEHFILVTHHTYFGRETFVDDFFGVGGLPKLRLTADRRFGACLTSSSPGAHDGVVRFAGERWGRGPDRPLARVAQPMTRSILEEMDDRYPGEPSALRLDAAPYWALAHARAVERTECDEFFVDVGRAADLDRLQATVSGRPSMFGIGETDRDEVGRDIADDRVGRVLEAMYPVPTVLDGA